MYAACSAHASPPAPPAEPEQLVDAAVTSILQDIALHDMALDRARIATQYLALLQHAQRQVALARIRDVG